MSEEYGVHIKNYDEWLKYYKNATKEQVIEDLTRDVQYFADSVKDIKDIKDLQQKVEQLEKIRKEAIELINKNSQYPTYYLTGIIVKNLLNILNKGDINE